MFIYAYAWGYKLIYINRQNWEIIQLGSKLDSNCCLKKKKKILLSNFVPCVLYSYLSFFFLVLGGLMRCKRRRV